MKSISIDKGAVNVSCSKAVHKENKKTKLRSREGTRHPLVPFLLVGMVISVFLFL